MLTMLKGASRASALGKNVRRFTTEAPQMNPVVQKNTHKFTKIGAAVVILSGVGAAAYYLQQNQIIKQTEESGEQKNLIQIAQDKWDNYWDSWHRPSSDKLLPDVPVGAERPVLVVNCEKLLVHLGYEPGRGQVISKRPFVNDFLEATSDKFEVVMFCDDHLGVLAPALEKLDPNQLAQKLCRDSALYKKGKYIKDLSKLNRPLDKVIMIEHRKDAFQLQPENAVVIQPWTGDHADTLLKDIIPWLEEISKTVEKNPSVDLRTEIHKYGNSAEEIVATLQERQRARERERQEQLLEASKAVQNKPAASKWKLWPF